MQEGRRRSDCVREYLYSMPSHRFQAVQDMLDMLAATLCWHMQHEMQAAPFRVAAMLILIANMCIKHGLHTSDPWDGGWERKEGTFVCIHDVISYV